MRRRYWKTFVILLGLLNLWACGERQEVNENCEKTGNSETSEVSFSGDVTMLKEERDAYVMQVTVENHGEDFSGTVQVLFAAPYRGNCAYNTELTLSPQEKKQFTLTVSDFRADTEEGLCALRFLNAEGKVLQSIPFEKVFPCGEPEPDLAFEDYEEDAGKALNAIKNINTQKTGGNEDSGRFGEISPQKEISVYSVTVQRTDGDVKKTFLLAECPDDEPWKLRLKDSYEMAGPGMVHFYAGIPMSANTEDYYHLISRDSEGRLSVGVKPDEHFRYGSFYAEGCAEAQGVLSAENILALDPLYSFGDNPDAGITNDTDYDMAYMAVWFRNIIGIFSDVKAGETFYVQQAVDSGRCVYSGSAVHYDDLFSKMIPLYDIHYGNQTDKGYEYDQMAALIMGLGLAEQEVPEGTERIVIAGIASDYDKVFDEDCHEVSYGCFYSFGEH